MLVSFLIGPFEARPGRTCSRLNVLLGCMLLRRFNILCGQRFFNRMGSDIASYIRQELIGLSVCVRIRIATC